MKLSKKAPLHPQFRSNLAWAKVRVTNKSRITLFLCQPRDQARLRTAGSRHHNPARAELDWQCFCSQLDDAGGWQYARNMCPLLGTPEHCASSFALSISFCTSHVGLIWTNAELSAQCLKPLRPQELHQGHPQVRHPVMAQTPFSGPCPISPIQAGASHLGCVAWSTALSADR